MVFDLRMKYEQTHYIIIFHCKSECTKFSQSCCTQHRWPKQWAFLKLNPKLFLILVVTTLHQTWPLYFLSMPCIWEGLWTFRNNDDNLNKTSPLKSMTGIGFFPKVYCHNPNFTSCWKYVLAVPLHGGKKKHIEYSQHGWGVLMIVGHHIEKFLLVISLTKEGVSSHRLRKN